MVRRFRVHSVLLLFLALAVASVGASAPVYAQKRVVAKRTIVESLDAVVDEKAKRASRTAGGYDFSVTRELLPPLDGDIAMQQPAGWVTVIEARNIETGSLPRTSSSASVLQFVVLGVAVLFGSIILFWRQVHPRLATVLSGVRLPSSMADLSIAPLLARLQAKRPRFADRFQTNTETAPKWDAETENASGQMTKLLAQIEGVVVRLKDGSPLRDVLNQELRLIHYRISAATDAARAGHDSSEKSAARFRGLVRELERVRRIADSAAASVIDPRDRLALPQTQSEAYALLGVNQEVSAPVLKKLVDALRMTWHPDHARNESDRLLREERIKQINSAWDLINLDVR